MLCPFHLEDVTFRLEKVEGRREQVYRCPSSECREEIPTLYVREYSSYPPVVVSAIGFRTHGKTVYFASLFYLLKKARLAQYWPEFGTLSLNEESLKTVYDNVEMLAQGTLPDASPKNFPRPTIVRLHGVPMEPDCTLLCYDTGGECFERPTQLVQYAGFVKRARTAMFLISPSKLADVAMEMHKLLSVYFIGMGQLGARTQDQHLAVVYTQADELGDRLKAWPDLSLYLTQGGVDGLIHPERYMKRLREISECLRQYTKTELGAGEFVNMAEKYFRSASFSIISALGSKPVGNRLPVQVVPRRVLDPLLWMQHRSQPGWKQAWRSWFG